MAMDRMSKSKKLALWAGGTAVAVLAGGLVGLSTSAQADSPTCGALKANVVGTYTGTYFNGSSVAGVEVILRNDNTMEVSPDAASDVAGTWAITDSAVVLTSPSTFFNGHVLVQGCAGAKLNAETLSGGVPAQFFELSLHRNA
ncbi:hypothetical protein [Streptomyces xanthophaeus]